MNFFDIRNHHNPATFGRDTWSANIDGKESGVTESDYEQKLEELDRLLNDPDVPMEPAKVWSLLAEISERDLSGLPHR